MKNWVAQHNISFELYDVEKVVRKKLTIILSTSGSLFVSKIEDSFINNEFKLDKATETSLRFQVNTG